MQSWPRVAALISILTSVVHGVGSPHAALAQDCESGTFSSTFELIEKAIFQRHGCTDDLCHGDAVSGGLDLRPGAAYESLVDVDAQSVPGYKRIVAGQTAPSLFWINLAAKTRPNEWRAPLRAMPADPQPALSEEELEALRLWIEKGAPATGVVPHTDTLLDACLPPPEPIAIKPLPAPAAGTGLQIKMPRWFLDAHREREICFAMYYDVTDQVPPDLRMPDGTFRYKFHQTRQDPLSHHMVPILYKGTTPPDSPLWGEWRCSGGARDGEVCAPQDTSSCGEGLCRSEPQNSIACIGYGPGDGGIGLTTAGISITQQTAEEFDYAPGVYNSLPMKGMILFSSHAFNLTDKPGKLEAWLNFEFAQTAEQLSPAIQVFDASAVFKVQAPAFGTDEPCNISVFRPTRASSSSARTCTCTASAGGPLRGRSSARVEPRQDKPAHRSAMTWPARTSVEVRRVPRHAVRVSVTATSAVT